MQSHTPSKQQRLYTEKHAVDTKTVPNLHKIFLNNNHESPSGSFKSNNILKYANKNKQ